MLSKTHLLFAIIVGIIILKLFNFPHPYLFLLIFCFFTLLPDIDSPNSKLGRKIWPISSLLKLFLGHRGIMHSIFIPLAIVLTSWHYGYLWIGYAAAGGYFLHLLVDATTVGGIKFFGPFGKKTKGFLRTGGFIESIIFLALGLLLLWLITKLI